MAECDRERARKEKPREYPAYFEDFSADESRERARQRARNRSVYFETVTYYCATIDPLNIFMPHVNVILPVAGIVTSTATG